jgi:hypothetical protein
MALSRPFAYNTGSPIAGTEQIGDIAIGWPTAGFGSTGLEWWNGPDEELGYVICKPVPLDNQPTPVGITASIGFSRSTNLTDESFLELASSITHSGYEYPYEAVYDLNANGFWTSYIIISPVLSLDAADYLGSGPWIDSVGAKSFTLNNSPTWSSSNGGYFDFVSTSAQSATCNTSLSDLSNWSVGVWHYYDGTNTGGNPCIVTEVYPGSVGQINYSLGDNNGGFSAGFFNGGWQVTDGYSLTPNNWYYIVGTYDGTDVKLYINNTLVDSTNYTGTPISSQGGIELMKRWDYGDYWGGKLAKVDIYNEALDSNKISSIWNTNKSRFGL